MINVWRAPVARAGKKEDTFILFSSVYVIPLGLGFQFALSSPGRSCKYIYIYCVSVTFLYHRMIMN